MVKEIQKKARTSKPTLVTDILKDIYTVLDKVTEHRSKNMGATCKKGCDSCCYLFTSMGIPEGLLIAEHLLQSGEWEKILPALKQAAIDSSFEGVTKTSYFKKKLPCVFLKDGLCSIYDIRPACCRLHVVISPPENCSPDAPPDTMTKAIDLIDVESEVWRLGARVAENLGVGFEDSSICFAPIPVMVFFCLALMSKNEPKVHEVILSYSDGIPPPQHWMDDHVPGLLAEGSGIEGRVRLGTGDLVQIEKR